MVFKLFFLRYINSNTLVISHTITFRPQHLIRIIRKKFPRDFPAYNRRYFEDKWTISFEKWGRTNFHATRKKKIKIETGKTSGPPIFLWEFRFSRHPLDVSITFQKKNLITYIIVKIFHWKINESHHHSNSAYRINLIFRKQKRPYNQHSLTRPSITPYIESSLAFAPTRNSLPTQNPGIRPVRVIKGKPPGRGEAGQGDTPAGR